MKILFDHQIFTLQKYGGISRYFYELISRLTKFESVEVKHSILYSNNVYLDDSFFTKPYLNYENWLYPGYFKGKNRLLKLFQYLQLVPNHNREMETYLDSLLRSGKIDLFHPTYYNPYFIELVNRSKVPYILTVHDLIHEKFSYFFEDVHQVMREKKDTISHAKRIIAISESTKKDIVEYFNYPSDQIDVIYHGNLEFNEEIRKDTPARENYILFVGNRDFYKNFLFFIESIQSLLIDNPDLKIIAAGGGPFSEIELNQFKKLRLASRIVHLNFKSDIELFNLYQKATLFVFPSLYEGFGIPLLEAMAAGCPVVCSNTSSFPEVASDAACYFDPRNSGSIEKAVREVYSKRDLQVHLRAKGFLNLKRFSWNTTVEQTVKSYRKTLGLV
ncbi:MAG: glycosyltransferase family 1 protein [Leptospira sp.]|nr:glycosyltransferase family 1 protein [Leptospira sp.]